MRKVAAFAIGLLLAGTVQGQDKRLDVLRATLLPMRGKPAEGSGWRGATPQLTVAKHQLRDWIESRLRPMSRQGDEALLARELNDALLTSGLGCDYSEEYPCPEWFQLGYVGAVAIESQYGFLIVRAGVGIECGFDQSIYIYKSDGKIWKRHWENEQNSYAKGKYFPQSVRSVETFWDYKLKRLTVLTLGAETWCESNWHNVYYRAFRVEDDGASKLLLEGSEWAFHEAHDPPIKGVVRDNDVLIAYTPSSLEGGIICERVMHFDLEGDRARRVAPFALSPRWFADEWVRLPWADATGLSRAGLRQGHENLHKKGGGFVEPTMRCPSRPSLWQVRVDFYDPTAERYFLVRWQPPYNLTMMDVGSRPFPGCTQEDPDADKPATIFPDWR